ncbi:MAG: hypothetical protein JWO37_3704 [Acidimicrobiales bacterium]|nr:hypothetical protein [Acidimicrobiales bacterium]
MAERESRPAFYAAAPGALRDWWTLLHPPYTAWHLAYVVIGASLASHTDATRLVVTVLAFFCAVGVAAHALDEVHGHPLRTAIPDAVLWLAAGAGLVGAVALGLLGLSRIGLGLLPFIVVGPLLVVGYNLELFGGRLHTDVAFALAWGTFPVLAGYYAQAERLGIVALMGGAAAFALSYAQRSLSTPARLLRRRVTRVEGALVMDDGTVRDLSVGALLEPLERALSALSWSMVALAIALAVARLR